MVGGCTRGAGSIVRHPKRSSAPRLVTSWPPSRRRTSPHLCAPHLFQPGMVLRVLDGPLTVASGSGREELGAHGVGLVLAPFFFCARLLSKCKLWKLCRVQLGYTQFRQ
jgi:hypothetical protein